MSQWTTVASVGGCTRPTPVLQLIKIRAVKRPFIWGDLKKRIFTYVKDGCDGYLWTPLPAYAGMLSLFQILSSVLSYA
jgi:hypothetical protein